MKSGYTVIRGLRLKLRPIENAGLTFQNISPGKPAIWEFLRGSKFSENVTFQKFFFSGMVITP
jgi:hypothetical protein